MKIGTATITDLKIGGTNIEKVYLGTTAVWERAPALPTTGSHPSAGDEFVGPFSSWTTLVATGDAATDTTNLQAAFDNLGKNSYSNTLYLTGNFVANKPLMFDDKMNVSLIGQSPLTTSITWAGASGGTIMAINGVAYSRIGRISFNGNNQTHSCVEQQWDNHTNTFDTDIEYFDVYFKNSQYGIRGGAKVGHINNGVYDISSATNFPTSSQRGEFWKISGNNTIHGMILQDEWTLSARFDTASATDSRDWLIVKQGQAGIGDNSHGFGYADIDFMRCKFTNCSVVGSWVGNFNALDIRHWDCAFDNCELGLSNQNGFGNFEAYNCIFKNCNTSAIRISAVQNFAFRNNFITNCGKFIDATYSNNGCQIVCQDNKILDCSGTPINCSNHGALILLRNVFRNYDGITVATFFINGTGEIIDIGNTYSDNISNPVHTNGTERLYYQDRSIVPRANLSYTEIVPSPLQPQLNRQVYSATVGMTAQDVQTLITTADTQNRGNRPVVHLPQGQYNWSGGVTIPSGSDVQVHGDGYGTLINWTGAPGGYAFVLAGPTKATISDLFIRGNGNGSGVKITNADQSNARVYIHNNEYQWYTGNALFVDAVNNVRTNVINTGFPYGSGTAIAVSGSATTLIHGGQGAANNTHVSIQNGAHLVVKGYWYENGGQYAFANLTDSGSLTIDQARMAPPVSSTTPFISTNGWNGNLTLIGCHVDDEVTTTGNGTNTKVLILGCLTPKNSFLEDTTSPAADARALYNRHQTNGSGGVGATTMTDAGTADATFISTMIADSLATVPPSTIAPLSSNVTDARLFRIFTTSCVSSVHVTASSVAGASTFNFTKTLRPRMRNNNVLELQKKLVSLGYSIKNPNGYFGIQTISAVKAFQTKHKLKADGIVGENTRRMLNK